jgi:hypothetical protein
LAYLGNRQQIYRCPPARITLVHDWIWARRGASTVVSLALLKRLNRVQVSCDQESQAVSTRA